MSAWTPQPLPQSGSPRISTDGRRSSTRLILSRSNRRPTTWGASASCLVRPTRPFRPIRLPWAITCPTPAVRRGALFPPGHACRPAVGRGRCPSVGQTENASQYVCPPKAGPPSLRPPTAPSGSESLSLGARPERHRASNRALLVGTTRSLQESPLAMAVPTRGRDESKCSPSSTDCGRALPTPSDSARSPRSPEGAAAARRFPASTSRHCR